MIIVGGIIKNEDNKYLLIKERKEKYSYVFDIIFVFILLKTFERLKAELTKLKYKYSL